MPFRYRLQKALDFRERKKEEQLIVVQKAQQEVLRIEQELKNNRRQIVTTSNEMRRADPQMMEAYDNFLQHLYKKDEEIQEELKQAQENLNKEKETLVEREKDVKVLEKHKERAKEVYDKEMKDAELKRLSEVAVQKHFRKQKEEKEEIEYLIENMEIQED